MKIQVKTVLNTLSKSFKITEEDSVLLSSEDIRNVFPCPFILLIIGDVVGVPDITSNRMSSNGTKFSTYWIGLIFGKNGVIRVTSSKARERKLMKAGLLSRLLKEKITVWNTGSITTEKMKILDASLWIWSLFFVLLGV